MPSRWKENSSRPFQNADLACIIHERMAKAFCGGLKLPKLLAAV
jgi:hypothetical protein